MDIIDSITKQVIQEGESVVLMFLINSRSENNDVGLLTRLHDQYKLASLPIKAVWGGGRFESGAEDQFAIQSLIKSMADPQVSSLGDLVEKLWDYGHQSIEKPHWNCSNMQEYSLFAVKPATLDKLASTSTIQANVPILNAKEHLPAAIAHAHTYMTHAKISNHDVEQDKRIDHFMEDDRLKRVFHLKSCHGYDEDYDTPLPYAVYALNRSSECRFAGKLLSTLHRERFAVESGELDIDRYSQFYEGTHLATAIVHALGFLDIPLAPTHWAQSRRREVAKMEFMSKVLVEDLNAHCSETRDYDDHPEKVVRDLISPLKTCVSDLTKLQFRLEDAKSKSRS
ncbi:hypothetical protein [Pseudomonas viridiflava]|uniref:hypothetical protein n=1 Tax=Pseudomonas viridiflava TaxID=33069 RepID=UPI000F0446A4|nr:hypothetical protein [Pseudomonas viridiflava]